MRTQFCARRVRAIAKGPSARHKILSALSRRGNPKPAAKQKRIPERNLAGFQTIHQKLFIRIGMPGEIAKKKRFPSEQRTIKIDNHKQQQQPAFFFFETGCDAYAMCIHAMNPHFLMAITIISPQNPSDIHAP